MHRDIKPANIMVEAGDRVKVTDFGIAKVTDSGEHLTMTGSLLGTPSYMSPEQARGGEIDGRSDLFSLGCVLYEMLAGRKAFRGDSITALIFKIITEEPPRSGVAADMPDAMRPDRQEGAGKSPDDRYQIGRELADDLLALTRRGRVPTLRQAETHTAPAHAFAARRRPSCCRRDARNPPTQASVAHAVAKPGHAAAPRGRGPAAPPTPVAAPGRPRRARAARKSGGGAGLLIGLGSAASCWSRWPAARAGTFSCASLRSGRTVAETVAPRAAFGGAGGYAEPAIAATPEAAPTTPRRPLPATLPAAATPGAPPPTAADAATPPAAPARSSSPTARALRRRAQDAPPPAETPRSAGSSAFLDEEPPQVDGAEAGARVPRASVAAAAEPAASAPRGATRARRSPRPPGPREVPAITTLRHVMDSQEAFYRKSTAATGPSPSWPPPATSFSTCPSGHAFQRRGYRFDLQVERRRLPRGGRSRRRRAPAPSSATTRGYIRSGVE